MTDEEKAEEYADSVEGYEIKTYSISDIEQAFLAGLKTGRGTEKEYVKNNAFISMKKQGLFPYGELLW